MNWELLLPLMVIAGSLFTGLLIFGLPEHKVGLRTTLNLAGASIKVILVSWMLWGVYNGSTYEVRLPLMPQLELVLFADTLSLFFLILSAGLWLVTTIYAIGYLEGSPNRSRFFGYFSLCVTSTSGVAMAGNLITFLIFYEMLTLVTYPLIVHRGTERSRQVGQSYLGFTLFGGTMLLLGTVWLYSITGTLEFAPLGFLENMSSTHHPTLIIIFFLLITGVGVKTALVPFHGWLPQAMVAPAPVSALLHAVAVVKAGAFGVVRIVYEVFGVKFAAGLGVMTPLALWASVTILYGSIRALFQDDLKRRLAFSTVSQVSYIVLGVAIAGPIATIGGVVHLVHQGFMKITLFFCAGNFAETLGVHRISEMNGIGKRMPLTMTAFTICAFGMIGAPPVAGFISKWYLGMGALEADQGWVIAVLAGSSLLNGAYFLPIVYRGWFKEPSASWPREHDFGARETSWALLLPPLVTAAFALGAGLFASLPFSPLGWAEIIAAREFY